MGSDRYFFKIPCFFILFFIWAEMSGQGYAFSVDSWRPEQGISHRQVYSILEDSKGFMWIGTEAGLNRMDGYSIREWSNADGSLHGQSVNFLAQDYQGYIWALSTIGQDRQTHLDLIDPANGRTYSAREIYKENFPVSQDELGYFLISNHDKNLYFQTSDRQSLIHLDSLGNFSTISLAAYNNVRLTSLTPEGRFRGIVGEGNLIQFSVSGDTLQEVKTAKLGGRFRFPRGNVKACFLSVAQDQDRQTYLLNEKFEIEPVHDISHAANLLNTLHALNIETLPLQEKLQRSLDNGGVFFQQLVPILPRSATNMNFCIYTSKDGAYWIGSSSGLVRITAHASPFSKWLWKDGIGPNSRQMQPKGDSMFVNTENKGLLAFDYTRPFPTDMHMNDLQTLADRYEGRISFNKGLGKLPDGRLFQAAGPRLSEVRPDGSWGPVGNAGSHIWWVIPMPNDKLLLGLTNGLAWYDLNTNQIQPYEGYNQYELLKKASVTWIGHDQQEQIWLATTTGLFRLSLEKGVVEHFSSDTDPALPCIAFSSLYQDKEGIYWLSTKGCGLIRWDRKTGSWEQFSKKDGLSNNFIHAAFEDHKGHLWLPSDNGLMNLDKQTKQVRNFFVKDGVANNEFNRSSFYQMEDGRLFFGGVQGITGFDPKAFYEQEKSQNESQISFSWVSLKVYNGDSLVDNTRATIANKTIQIQPSDLYIRLEYALLAHGNMEPVRYAWRLEDEQTDWIDQESHILQLNRLPYGQQTIRIRALQPDGTWAQKELQLNLEVLKPFYLQNWFLVSMGFLLLAGVIIFVQWKSYRLRKAKVRLEKEIALATEKLLQQAATLEVQNDQLEKGLREKETLLKEIHHRVKNNMQVISGLLQLQSSKSKNPEVREVMKVGQGRIKSMALVHQMLYQHDDLGAIDFKNYMEKLINYAVASFGRKGVEVKLEDDGTRLEIETAVHIGLIVNELLTNCYKYAFDKEGGTILIQNRSLGDGRNELIVADNGRGLPEGFNPKKAKSLGLRLANLLSDQIRAEFELTSKEGEGTRAVLRYSNRLEEGA